MSFIQILKEDYLYEDETTTNPDVSTSADNQETTENDGKEYIDKTFVIKLCNYIEQLFPGYGSMDNSILNEVRKKIDETDPKIVKKTKEKIHSIILDERKKLLKRIQTRVEKLRIIPKKEAN